MFVGLRPCAACYYLSNNVHVGLCLQAGMRTFSVRSGVQKVFWICIGLLELAYVGGMVVGFGSQVRTTFGSQSQTSGRKIRLRTVVWAQSHCDMLWMGHCDLGLHKPKKGRAADLVMLDSCRPQAQCCNLTGTFFSSLPLTG